MKNQLYYYALCLFPCSGSCTDDPEELACHRTPPPNDQDQLTSGAQQKPSSSQKLSLDDLDVTPEKEGMIITYWII